MSDQDWADNPSFKRGITRAPFSQTTVRHLMVLQNRHDIHPYTCANRGNGKHEKIGGQTGILVPTADGWVCPDCNYTQDWCHNSFLNAIAFDVAFDSPILIRSTPSSDLVGAVKEFISWYDEARKCELETGHNSTATVEAHTEEYEALEKVRSALSGVAKVCVRTKSLSVIDGTDCSCGVTLQGREQHLGPHCYNCGLPIKLKENGDDK